MLTINPAQRPSAVEVLNDSWLSVKVSSHLQDKDLGVRVLENMKNFRVGAIQGQCKLRQATFQYIASQLMSQQETKELREIFLALDENRDGKLSREELARGYHLLDTATMKNIEKIMEDCDADGNGFIDYSEFLTACLEWQHLLSQERLTAAFKAYDTDNSGTISMKEIKQMLQGDEQVGDDVWNEVLREADTNGDGVIDLDEFKSMMLRRAQR